MPQDSVSHICNKCVDEEYLSHAIETTGVIQTCSYCSGSRHCITVEVLADRIETAFAEHFVRTHNEPDDWEEFLIRDPESNYIWTRSGYPVLDAIQGAARISTEAAEDVLEILQYRHTDIESAQMGEESEFGPDTYYEEKDSNDLPWQSEWRKFEEALKTEARYFSRSAAAHLDAIFGGIDQLRTFDGQQLVADAGPGTDLETLFRARVFQSESALIEAIGRPDLHVGPTPPRKATAGRMNARGISVFYGAKERSVALAEVRPPVGSDVVVAEFLIIRHLRLLNLPALKTAIDHGSIFDPSLRERLARVAFLRTLGSKMTRPVMPDDQDFDYLATQAVADFLATENNPPLDGIIFESTQAGEGANVVLFRKASRLRELDIPQGTKIRATTHNEDRDGPYIDMSVVEEIPPPLQDGDHQASGESWVMAMFHQPPKVHDPRPETLKVIADSVEVHHVNRVVVECDAHHVDRTRRVRFDSDKF